MKFLLVLTLFSITLSAKLPPNFKKCHRKEADFLKCLAKATEDAMSKGLNEPLENWGLPSLNPLEVPSMTISAGTKAVGLQQHFKDVKIFGINDLKCPRMDVDFEGKKMENLCYYPLLRIQANYEFRGKILLLDVYGSGPANITLEKVKIPVHYKFEEYEKNGRKHYRITDTDLKLEPERVQYRFDNLFDGEKTLSDNIHRVINENWKEVFDDVRGGYNDVFGKITSGIFNALLSRVPASEIFGEE